MLRQPSVLTKRKEGDQRYIAPWRGFLEYVETKKDKVCCDGPKEQKERLDSVRWSDVSL